MNRLIIRDITLMGLALTLLAPSVAGAGTLNSPAPPTDAGSAMYSTDAIYQRLQTGEAGTKRSGGFVEPQAKPGATGRSLAEIMAVAPTADNTRGAAPSEVKKGKRYWGLRSDGSWGPQTGTAKPAPVARSGQTVSTTAGDDGALQTGVAWPSPRFTDNHNGTVTDNLTGLIWLKNANCFSQRRWNGALNVARGLNSGECGLTDGSVAGAWRLPQIQELKSLVDWGRKSPALPGGGVVFSGAQSANYWSSTVYTGDSSGAWFVNFDEGVVYYDTRYISAQYPGNTALVWPVRGGQ